MTAGRMTMTRNTAVNFFWRLVALEGVGIGLGVPVVGAAVVVGKPLDVQVVDQVEDQDDELCVGIDAVVVGTVVAVSVRVTEVPGMVEMVMSESEDMLKELKSNGTVSWMRS